MHCVFVLLLALILAMTACGITGKTPGGDSRQENAALTVTAFKIGKADAIVLEAGGSTVVIDTGEEEDGEEILTYLKRNGCEAVDLLIITHFDKDHVGGAETLVKGIDIRDVVIPDYVRDSKKYERFMDALKGKEIEPERLRETKQLSPGGMEIRIDPPETYDEAVFTEKYDNNCSLLTKVTYGSRSFLFTGDIEAQRIRALLKEGADLSADVLKMPHHGRYDALLPELLAAVSPELALICDSDKNPADEETLDLLRERDIQTYETRRGNIVVICDGERIVAGNQK